LTGLATRNFEQQEETSTSQTASGAFDESALQDIDIDTDETIGRAVLSRQFETLELSFGAEAAYNSLEQNLRLTEDAGAGPVPIVLPSANVLVEEKRAEAFVTLSLQPADQWTVEATVAAETSQLSQTGDVNQTTDLTYWKPSLQVVRKFGQANQMRMRIYRDIGQLDFGDFVSAAEFDNNLVVGGNPDLKPETSWRLEAADHLRFGPETSIEIMLFVIGTRM
jgi:outer membrane receptor protein involved in Fe transport